MQDAVAGFRARYQRLEALKQDLVKAKITARNVRIEFNRNLTMPQPGGTGKPQEPDELKQADAAVKELEGLIDAGGKALDHDTRSAASKARGELVKAIDDEMDKAGARVPGVRAKIQAILPEFALLVGAYRAREHFSPESTGGAKLRCAVPEECGLLPALDALRDKIKWDNFKRTPIDELAEWTKQMAHLEAILVKYGVAEAVPASAAVTQS